MYSHVASYPEHPFDTGTLIHTVVYIRHNDTLVRNCLDGTVRSEPCTKLYRASSRYASEAGRVRAGGYRASVSESDAARRGRGRRAWRAADPWRDSHTESLHHDTHGRPMSRPSGWLEQVGRWAGRARHEDGHEAPSCACGAAYGPRCLGHNVARRALGGEEGDDETAGHERGAMWPSAWVRRAGEREVGEGRRRRLRTVGDSQLVERCAGQLAFFLRGARGCKDGYRW